MMKLLYALVISIIALPPAIQSQTPIVLTRRRRARRQSARKVDPNPRLLRIARVNHRFSPRL
jgi:hypothetical protein